MYDRSIFVVGGSSVYGFGCEDQHTLPSFLQKYFNNLSDLKEKYSVFNLGARGAPKFVDFYKLLNLNVSENDIVILQGIEKNIIQELSTLEGKKFHLIIPDLSHRVEEGIFFDSGHVNYKGHEIIAQQICERLTVTDNKESGKK